MSNIYVHFLQNELPQLIQQITQEHQPEWGKMSAQHMLEHLSLLFAISNGKIPLPDAQQNPEKIAHRKQKFFIEDLPFERNIRVAAIPEEPVPLKYENISEAKKSLLNGIDKFFNHFAEQPDSCFHHPVFGALAFNEWCHFHTKHCKHHFSQFKL